MCAMAVCVYVCLCLDVEDVDGGRGIGLSCGVRNLCQGHRLA